MKIKEVEGAIKDEVKEMQEESLGKRKRSIGSGNRAPRRKNGRQKKPKEEKQKFNWERQSLRENKELS